MISFDQLYKVPAWLEGTGPEADVIISSRIRLARNLSDHQFPLRASLQERASVFSRVSDVCGKIPQCKGFSISNFTTLNAVAQHFLIEERVASPDLAVIDGDRGVLSDQWRRVNIMVNEEDHLRLTLIDSGFCAENLWAMADALDTAIGSRLAFAYDARRGFLTACPSNAGTGLRVSFLMHLPGLVLTKTIDQVLQGACQMGVSVRGFLGEHSAITGNFFQLSNHATMGASESGFIESTQLLIRRITGLEREARQRIMRDAKTQLADKVYRAYGILRFARTLHMNELLNLSSALRIGIETGLYDGLTSRDLNRFILLCMPAHLQTLFDRVMTDDEVLVQRAELVRDLLEQKM